MYFVWSILPPPPDQNYFAVKLWWFFVSGTSRNQDMCVFRRSEWKCLKEAEMKEFILYRGKRLIWPAAIRFFFSNEKRPRGMFWTKMAQNGPPGTPRKRALFLERGRKRMKEWGEVTFMKEWVKALDKTRILAPADIKFVVSFPRYGHLKIPKGPNQISLVYFRAS